MHVLVVGGAGYVGGAVTDLLQKSGHDVRVYDALLYEESYRKPVDFVYGDVRDPDRLRPHLDWADAVVWLAALVGDPACALHPDISVAINQEAVAYLAAHFDGRIVFMSTCSVYGAQARTLDESSPTAPLSVYASTKLQAEKYLAAKNAIIFRLGTLFGIGDTFARIRFDLVVNTLTLRAHKLGTITVHGGEQFRPLLHVRDAAAAVVENITTTNIGIYNLRKENVQILDLAEQVRRHFPGVVIERSAMEIADGRNYRVAGEKATHMLGFRPIYSIDDGIEEIKSLLECGRLRDVDNPRYTNQTYLSLYRTHLNRASV
jgi:nucleoside-diphosphate-sugar epimerase